MFIKNGSFKKHTHIISYVPPTIITQPIGGTKSQGNDFTFNISARGSRPLTYQWYKNFSPILNETTNKLILTNLQITDDSEYYCVVSNNGYSTDSDIVKLNVLVPLTFTSQPSSVQVNLNSNVSFSSHATGTPPITYKWFKNSVLYPGTSDIIYINHVTKNEEGSYFVVASNLVTSITSNTATLTINDGIIIKDQPDDTSLNVGDNLTLTLSCVGTFPISAQWRKNNTNYGSLSVTNNGDVKLEISNIQNTDTGNYDCVLTNLVNSVTSNKSIVYISQPPVFTINPLSGTGTEGQSYTFTSNATGTNPISYQWIKQDIGNIIGATFKNYTLSNLQFSNSGNYACIASNLYGSVTSNFASLSVSQQIIKRYWTSVAMSSDGTKQTAVNSGYQIYISTDSGNTWTAKESNRNWNDVAISSDGTKQTAVYNGGQIYISTDSGNTWTAKESNRTWASVAMSSDGTIQTAVDSNNGNGGQIYISTDSGNTWTAKESNRYWNSVAMSSDGTIQTAVEYGGQIYVSTDSGNTWTAKESNRDWTSVAMSSDGTKQTAVVFYGKIYVSTDSGNTWTAKESNRRWSLVAMSSDGTKQTAVNSGGQIYISIDSGNTWIAKESNRYWSSVAMSSDGTKQTAVVVLGQIYVSSDSGNTWIAKNV